MPRPLLILSQPDYLIQVVDTNSHTNVDPDQFTVSKGRAYLGSAGPGLRFKSQQQRKTVPGLDCLRTVVSEVWINLSQNSNSFLSSYRFVLKIDFMAARQALTATGFLLSVVLADISRKVPRVR